MRTGLNNLKTVVFGFLMAAMATSAASCNKESNMSVSSGDNVDGHDAVDLGLSVLWATCNLGAETPQDYGNYYTWGETDPKDSYGLYDEKWWSSKGYTKYNDSDKRTTLSLDDDAAQANYGGRWRMPTREEFKELIDKCSWEFVRGKGYKVKSKINGNSIFLPVTGYYEGEYLLGEGSSGNYLSASVSEKSHHWATSLVINSSGVELSDYYRYCGKPVRPVINAQD